MRITKKQLKRIIQEETKAIVDEGWWPFGKKDEPEPEESTPSEPSGLSKEKLAAMWQDLYGLEKVIVDKGQELGSHLVTVWEFMSAKRGFDRSKDPYDNSRFPIIGIGAGKCRRVGGDRPEGCKDLESIKYSFRTHDAWYSALMHNPNLSIYHINEVRKAFAEYVKENMPAGGEKDETRLVAAVKFLDKLLKDIDHDIQLVSKYTDSYIRSSDKAKEEMRKFYDEWEDDMEWRGGDMRTSRQKSGPSFGGLEENKINKTDLQKIIKEAIQEEKSFLLSAPKK